MNHRKIRFPIISLFLLLSTHAFAQQREMPIALTPLIGDTLDRVERDYYRILPRIEGFVSAVFYLNPDSTLRVRIRILRNGAAVDTVIEKYSNLSAARNRIAQVDKLQNEADEPVVISREYDMMDGSVIHGTVARETKDTLFVSTTNRGVVAVPRDQVAGNEKSQLIHAGASAKYQDPCRTRTAVMPTATTLKGGSGYITNYMMLYMSIAVGLTDRLMVSAGGILIPLDRDEGTMHHLGAKVRLFDFSDKASFAIGGECITNQSDADAWFGYGVLSLGDADKKVNFAVGTGLDLHSGISNALMGGLSGDVRVNDHVKMFLELYVSTSSDFHGTPFIAGIRFFGKSLTCDLGVYSGAIYSIALVPIVNIAVFF